ncbi:YaaL family protein [Jeotgalibacillus proteolyticus]|uniref:YaaL family protein n=1 Tax=Jeotgalibacillus proteolyticus TaxID=2082395 RepID=UPI003CE97781
MLFRKKGKLKKEFDDQLIELMAATRDEWRQQKNMAELSIEVSGQSAAAERLCEAKYFYLFKEARQRKIVIK